MLVTTKEKIIIITKTNKQMNTTNNKTKKAFNYNDAKNLRHELSQYINANLYDNNLTIQKDNKIIVFNWNFEPQRTGTGTQQQTYKNLTIRNKAEQIINHLNK